MYVRYKSVNDVKHKRQLLILKRYEKKKIYIPIYIVESSVKLNHTNQTADTNLILFGAKEDTPVEIERIER